MNHKFEVVGIRANTSMPRYQKKKWYQGKPVLSMMFLAVIILGSLGCRLFLTRNPEYMDLSHCSEAPGKVFLFGTDTMGRDIFFYDMVWGKNFSWDWISFNSNSCCNCNCNRSFKWLWKSKSG